MSDGKPSVFARRKLIAKFMCCSFYLRSSFLFQVIFVACWVCAYMYMVKLHPIRASLGASYLHGDLSSHANISFYGYGFVILNILQGAFILVFHCVQNERVSTATEKRIFQVGQMLIIKISRSAKVRREYRKFVRQQTWLPKCLQEAAAAAEDERAADQNTGAETNNILSGSPHHIGGSFLSASTQSTTNQQPLSGVAHQTMVGTLMKHQTLQAQRHNAVAAYTTGTLRDNRSSQQISPSSSAGSAQLINNMGAHKSHQYEAQRPDMIYPQSQQFHQLHGKCKRCFQAQSVAA